MTNVNPFGNYFEMTFADIATFGKAPTVDSVKLEDCDIGVFGIPWDFTATLRPGARLGARAIREQSIWFHEVWNPVETPLISYGPVRGRKADRVKMVDCGDVTIWPGDIHKTSAFIRSAAARVASHAFPIMLGGDHYVMFPTYQGLCDANPGKRVGIIQVDAHNDLVDDDPIYGKYWSGTPMRRSLEHSGVSPRAHAQIGLRGFIGAAERNFQIENGTNVFDMPTLRALGPEEVARRAINAVLEHCDIIYLTLDIDSVDPSHAPGCSTPVPGGLRSDEFLTLVRALGRSEKIAALDIVEVSPPLDPTHQTPLLAAHALFGFIEERFLLSQD
ncbi:agmatinase family protein [Pseudomonas sp. R2.Fl]|nr:agmatinase family protein [Pseudomonas sp. R2.Fl]